MTASEATTPRATFSASRPPGPTRPRVTRAKAFSSRSSASEPATRSTVTNISVTVAATAIAKSSSSAVSPAITCLSTSIGCEIAPSSGRARSRLSPASWANWVTWRANRGRGCRRAARHRPRAGSRPPGRARGCRSRRAAGSEKLPPGDQQVEIGRRLVGDLLGEDQVRLGDQRLDPVVDEARLHRVVLVHEHLDHRLLGVQRGERAELVEQVRRAGSAPRSPRRPRPSAPPPRARRRRRTRPASQSSSRAWSRSISPSPVPIWNCS